MKQFLTIVALVGTVALFSGCASCCGKCTEKKADCGMQCCADAKTTCDKCPTCSAKK